MSGTEKSSTDSGNGNDAPPEAVTIPIVDVRSIPSHNDGEHSLTDESSGAKSVRSKVHGRAHSNTILEIKTKTEKKLSVYGNVECLHNPRIQWRSTKPHPSLRSAQGIASWRHPFWMGAFILSVPAAFVGLVYGGIPLGEPDGDLEDKFVYMMVFTPWTFTAYAFLMIAFFLGCLDNTHPWAQWTAYAPTIFSTYVGTMAIMYCIYPFTDSFRGMGFIPYGVTWIIVVGGLWLFRRFHSTCICNFYNQRRKAFIKIMVMLALMFALFTGYTLVFREVPSIAQKGMSIGWVFVLLFIKKGGLAITEPIQIELAMLISGFFFQNTFDTFFVLVYPNVEDPVSTFLIVWFATAFGDFAYLGFLSNPWFKFRIWIKGRLRALFCCEQYDPIATRGVTVDLDPDDRGQSRLQPGYRRRQVQFYFFRLFSRMSAQIFYLVVAPTFRYWNNADYYPFSEETTHSFSENPLNENSFRNSMLYAGLGVIWVLGATAIGFFYIRRYYREVFDQLRGMYSNLLVAPLFFGFILASVVSNQLLATWLMIAHNQIWFLPVE
mmetsp:Transcript_1306/g.1811  ORF Transcript_1306/g.1811 Transcript_1306/m.1811 type:complete len:548 (-) Transcript_1306:26-1669(-)